MWHACAKLTVYYSWFAICLVRFVICAFNAFQHSDSVNSYVESSRQGWNL